VRVVSVLAAALKPMRVTRLRYVTCSLSWNGWLRCCANMFEGSQRERGSEPDKIWEQHFSGKERSGKSVALNETPSVLQEVQSHKRS
jgi:hypothetical protein